MTMEPFDQSRHEVSQPAYVVPSAPAGWYPDNSMVNTVRFWDGSRWTSQLAPAAPQQHSPKEVGIAYLLFFLLGGFAAHRFYLGRVGSAIGFLAVWWIGWLTVGILVGLPLVAVGAIWLVVDVCTIPQMVRQENARRSMPTLPWGRPL